jgi:hypothetical protein
VIRKTKKDSRTTAFVLQSALRLRRRSSDQDAHAEDRENRENRKHLDLGAVVLYDVGLDSTAGGGRRTSCTYNQVILCGFPQALGSPKTGHRGSPESRP